MSLKSEAKKYGIIITHKMIECPECKGEGTLDRCEGDCYHEAHRICDGMDTGECEDGYLVCQTCKGEGEIEMKSLSKAGMKEYISRTHDGCYKKPYDLEELVISIVSRYTVYKSYLLSAIAEVYLIPPHVVRSGIDYNQGEGKYIYDSLSMALETLVNRGILEPYTKGKPIRLKRLKLKGVAGSAEYTIKKAIDQYTAKFVVGGIVPAQRISLSGDVVSIPKYRHTPQGLEQVCPDCLGEGRVSCAHLKVDCTALKCPDGVFGDCDVTCKTCGGKGKYIVPEPNYSVGIDLGEIEREVASTHIKSIDMAQDTLDNLKYNIKRKRRGHKRYEVSNEEVKVKRGKHKVKKYNIIKGELV